MRSIYNQKIIGKLEQGSILNCCFASHYSSCNVAGIIITPRCDLVNSKVSTVHYLPIVKMSDWLEVDFWNVFSGRLRTDLQGRIKNIFGKYSLSSSILQGFRSEVILSTVKPLVSNNKDFQDLEKLFSQLNRLTQEDLAISRAEKKILFEEFQKISKAILKELRENKLKEYYLIESWQSSEKYSVVLTREVRSLEWGFANRLSKGIRCDEILEDDFKFNSIGALQQDGFLSTLATLKSPFMEHLIQHFYLNFGRIGVEDHSWDSDDVIYEEIKLMDK